MLKQAVRVIYQALVAAYDGFWMVWLAELIWLALSLPVVTAPAAAAGMYYTMRQLANGESVEWKMYFTGVRRYLWAGYRWFGVNLLVVGLLAFYAWFFSTTRADWGKTISGIPIGLLILWAIFQTFTFPFMLEQEKPSYMNALRNSLVFFIKWPALAFSIVIFNGAVLALSVWLRFPWAILSFSLTALVACQGVMYVLETAQKAKTIAEGNG